MTALELGGAGTEKRHRGDLAASAPVATTAAAAKPPIKADADGIFSLEAGQSTLNGSLQTEKHGNVSNIGFWNDIDDTAVWTLTVTQPGTYAVTARYASPAPSEFLVDAANQTLDAKVLTTGDFSTFQTAALGSLKVQKAGFLQKRAERPLALAMGM